MKKIAVQSCEEIPEECASSVLVDVVKWDFRSKESYVDYLYHL